MTNDEMTVLKAFCDQQSLRVAQVDHLAVRLQKPIGAVLASLVNQGLLAHDGRPANPYRITEEGLGLLSLD